MRECVRHVTKRSSGGTPHAVCTAALGARSFRRRHNVKRHKARVSDPEHKALLAKLARHFGRAGRRAKRDGRRMTTTTTSKVTQITRRMNPGRGMFKLFVFVRGRTWAAWDGKHFTVGLSQPKEFPTPGAAWTEGKRLRRQHAKELRNAKFYVGEEWPKRA